MLYNLSVMQLRPIGGSRDRATKRGSDRGSASDSNESKTNIFLLTRVTENPIMSDEPLENLLKGALRVIRRGSRAVKNILTTDDVILGLSER